MLALTRFKGSSQQFWFSFPIRRLRVGSLTGTEKTVPCCLDKDWVVLVEGSHQIAVRAVHEISVGGYAEQVVAT